MIMDFFKPILNLVWGFAGVNDTVRLKRQHPPENIEENYDIPYLSDGLRGHLLDVYVPQSAGGKKLPVIVDVHGGGWMYGYKEINRPYCLALAEKGFIVVNINYRLCGGKDRVHLADQLQDCFAAFSWVRENIAVYGGDTGNMFLTGDSAGGNLTCLSAAVCANEKLAQIAGVPAPGQLFRAYGATSPMIDFTQKSPLTVSNRQVVFGKDYKNDLFYKTFANFAKIAGKELAPFYLVTSNGDFLQEQGKQCYAVLLTNGVDVKFHNWTKNNQQHVFSVIEPFKGPGQIIIEEMTRFFKSKMAHGD